MIYHSKNGIGHKPPLSLLSIAAYIKEMTPHDVSVLDCPAMGLKCDDITGKIYDYMPNVVGITVWTDFLFSVHKIIEKIKSSFPECYVVIGGVHVNIFMEKALETSMADALIAGEGETPMMLLMDEIARGERARSPHSFILKRGELGEKAVVPYTHESIDRLPAPDRSLLPLSQYTSVLSHERSITTMITSRGCPYSCTFCRIDAQKVQLRSADNVVKEFISLRDMGIKEVEVYDDTFTLSKTRVADICRGLIENNVNLVWSVRDRVSTVNRECLRWMRRAGCNRIHLGIESGSDRILKAAKKGITVKQARDAVSIAKEEGFTVLTYFMFGLMEETTDDVLESIRLAVELDTDFCEFSITIPYPGTELYRCALERGIIDHDYWEEFAGNPVKDYSLPSVIENRISMSDLIKFRNMACRRFYFRPVYIWRQIKRLRNLTELKRKAGMAFSLLKMNAGLAGNR